MRVLYTMCLRPRPERASAQSRGLSPLPGERDLMRDNVAKTYWVYILASKPRGVLYTGMTSDLAGRSWQHRERVMDGFAKTYWAQRLVYFEAHNDAKVAAQRERAMKRWRRD